MKILTHFLLTLIVVGIVFTSSAAQNDLTPQALSDGDKTESKETIEKQAHLLLDQVIAGIGPLKLPENRSRLEIVAADLLWKRDQARARALFSDAAANVIELEKQPAGCPY